MDNLPVRDGHVYRPVNVPSAVTTRDARVSSLSFLILIACGLGCIWFYVSGRYKWNEYRERMHRRDMRRRHGIPDHDKRPFDIAYKEVSLRLLEKEKEKDRLETELHKRQEIPQYSTHDKENLWPEPHLPSNLLSQDQGKSSTLRSRRSPSPRVHFITPPQVSMSRSVQEPTRHSSTPERDIAEMDLVPPGALPSIAVLPLEHPTQSMQQRVITPPMKSRKRIASSSDEEKLTAGRSHQAKKSRLRKVLSHSNSDDSPMQEDYNSGNPLHSQEMSEEIYDIVPDNERTRSKRRISDVDSEVEIVEPRATPKRRLNSGTSDGSPRRGTKRERSDIGSFLGDPELDLRHSRKRERLQIAPEDLEMMKDIQEDDVDENMDEFDEIEEDTLTQSPDLDEALPFSADPLCQGRHVGEEWEVNKQRYKVGTDGTRLRHALVKQMRRKFNMPKDSVHPDALQEIQVIVECWLTEEEYKVAKDRQELAWQDGYLNSTSNSGSRFVARQPDGKRLLWSSPLSSPGPSSKQTDHPAPNPFQDSKRMPSRRSVLSHSISSNPAGFVVGQLHKSRSLSKLEKQDIEAAAMARLRQTKSNGQDVSSVTVKAPITIASSSSDEPTSTPSKVPTEPANHTPNALTSQEIHPPTFTITPPNSNQPSITTRSTLFSTGAANTSSKPVDTTPPSAKPTSLEANSIVKSNPGSKTGAVSNENPLSTFPSHNGITSGPLPHAPSTSPNKGTTGMNVFASSSLNPSSGVVHTPGSESGNTSLVSQGTSSKESKVSGSTSAPVFGIGSTPLFGTTDRLSSEGTPQAGFFGGGSLSAQTKAPTLAPATASSNQTSNAFNFTLPGGVSTKTAILGQQPSATPLFGKSAGDKAPESGFPNTTKPVKSAPEQASDKPVFGQSFPSGPPLFGATSGPSNQKLPENSSSNTTDSTNATPPHGMFGRAIRRLPASRMQPPAPAQSAASDAQPTFSFNFGTKETTSTNSSGGAPNLGSQEPSTGNSAPSGPSVPNPFGSIGTASFSFATPPPGKET